VSPTLDPARTWLAHLSDLHLLAPGAEPQGRPPAEWYHEVPARWQLAIAELKGLEVEFSALLLTGDLSDGARPAEFELLRGLLQDAPWPVIATPGNHDRQDLPAWDQLFGSQPPQLAGWNVAPLDTSACHETTEEDLAAALEVVRETPAPALHPTHSPLIDAGNFVDPYSLRSPELLEALSAAPSPRLVVTGHTHKTRVQAQAGTIHIGGPSLAYGIGDEVGYLLIGLGSGLTPEVWRRVLPGPSRRLGGQGAELAGEWRRHDLA
jgi:3',5'-cyclic-AMP phosphodiesterase